MNVDFLTDLLTGWMPSLVGSFGALLWMQGSFRRLLGLWIVGAFCGFYAGGYIVKAFDLPHEVSGFVVGLFGMSIADKMFKTLDQINLSELLMGFFRRFLK